ncbi:class I SAM-dependent methyltransferase [Cellvibrio polysaccharolyticus]|uniref:class I SAM-dependent methyltransferase n=1 Tax=Cellvibrio polysaccharolyticus TaxID=2082724 RepID=UPI001933D6B9|nr:class I SAM-dependent methyltransferase [Cellvibrio polysaccharolyticus]
MRHLVSISTQVQRHGLIGKGILTALVIGFSSGLAAAQPSDALAAAVKAEHRSETNKARDVYRHPVEILQFFDVQPSMTVVEVWPGAGGWYTEILAPLLRKDGKLIAAHFPADSEVGFFQKARATFDSKIAAAPALYDQVSVIAFAPPAQLKIADAGSVDRILTFRNVHNWYMNGGEENVLAVFREFHKTLKSGGILGVVDHRLPAADSEDKQASSGYMHESFIVRLAEQAGFRLEARSEVNANARDTADYTSGVWTLPPTLRQGDQDREKYLAIGESDRMTLKFVKP